MTDRYGADIDCACETCEARRKIVKPYVERIEELLKELKDANHHYDKAAEVFVENLKEAFNEGFAQGRSYQAILEIRARESFLKTRDKKKVKSKE